MDQAVIVLCSNAPLMAGLTGFLLDNIIPGRLILSLQYVYKKYLTPLHLIGVYPSESWKRGSCYYIC